jgi:DNA helicase HerA-like ATPase
MQLTNPDDQRAVQKASEAISAELLADLPGLNKGEAIVLGQLTRIPVMLSVSARASAEGGSDVDVVEELRKAVQAKSTQRAAQEMRGRGAVARQREEW